jgi:hypothetical protein
MWQCSGEQPPPLAFDGGTEQVKFLLAASASTNGDSMAMANALRAMLHLVAHSQQPLAEVLFSAVRHTSKQNRVHYGATRPLLALPAG